MPLRTPIDANRPAHSRVTALDAHKLYRSNNVDWPVSGDETPRAIGYVGMRAAQGADLWQCKSVKAPPTAGVRTGSRITLRGGITGVVTAVGSIAGWMIPDDQSRAQHNNERRWDAWEIETVERTDNN